MIEIARKGFRIYFIAYPLVGAQIVIQNFFQSIGRPVPSIFLSLTRQFLFLLPMLWILPPLYGVSGVWLSMAFSDILAAIVAIITVIVIIKIDNHKFITKPAAKSKAVETQVLK